MAFIVETGAGTPGANANCTPAFVTQYLTERGRETENGWSTLTDEVQKEKIVAATDFIEVRWSERFKGSKARLDIAGRVASGALTLSGLPNVNDTLTVGLKTYRLVSALTQENDVLIGGTVAETVANLVSAIGGVVGLGDVVEEHTQPNYEVLAIDESPQLTIVAQAEGTSGNSVVFSKSMANSTITGSGFLTDGLDEGEQPLSFPRVGLYTRSGAPVLGMPLKVKQATAEYSVRAAAAALMPDPTVDASLVGIQRKREKVGPIEEETEFVVGATRYVSKPYPAADKLLAEFITEGGGCVRG